MDIPTIDGSSVKIKIEPGTQPGKTLRLRGKGLPAVQGYGNGTGDLIIQVSVFIPKTSSDKSETIQEAPRVFLTGRFVFFQIALRGSIFASIASDKRTSTDNVLRISTQQ